MGLRTADIINDKLSLEDQVALPHRLCAVLVVVSFKNTPVAIFLESKPQHVASPYVCTLATPVYCFSVDFKNGRAVNVAPNIDSFCHP